MAVAGKESLKKRKVTAADESVEADEYPRKASGNTSKSQDGSSFVTVESGFKTPSRIPLTSSGSMSADDALALFQSLGVARITTADAVEGGKQDKAQVESNKAVGQGEEVMFDVEVTTTEEAGPDFQTKPKTSPRLGYSCAVCGYVTPYSASLKRHHLVKHGILGEVEIQRCSISESVADDKSGKGLNATKATNVYDGRSKDLGALKSHEVCVDDFSRAAVPFEDSVQFKASRAREPLDSQISLSPKKFSDPSIESILKMPVSSLASLKEKDAWELLKSLRQAAMLQTPQILNDTVSPDPVESVDPDPSPDSESEAPPGPSRSKSGQGGECEFCGYSTPYNISMRRHMLVKHGLVQDIFNATPPLKKASVKASTGRPKKPSKMPRVKRLPKK